MKTARKPFLSLLVLVLLAGALSAPLSAQGSDMGLYMPLDDFAVVSSGPANVVLNGSVVVNAPELEIQVPIDGQGVPTGVSLELLLAGGVTLEVTADADGGFSQTLPVAQLPLPAFPVGVNILVLPFAVILLEVEGQAAAGLRASFVQEFEVPLELNIGAGFDTSAGPPDVVNMWGSPELAGGSTATFTADATAAVIFLISYNGIVLGGPLAGASFGVDLGIDPVADPWWTLDGHVSPFTGFAGPSILTFDLPTPPFFIADAGGPLLAGPSTRWSESLHVDGPDVLHSVTPTDAGLVAVAQTDGDRSWAGLLDESGTFLGAVRSDPIPSGFQTPVAALPQDDGGLIVVGHAPGVRVDRLDAAGQPVWSRRWEHPTAPTLSVAAAVALPDGGFALAGTASTIVPAGSVAWVARFDADGLFDWATEVDPGPGVTYSSAAALVRCADGDLALAGAADFEEFDGPDLVLGNKNVWLARLSEDGLLRWATSAGTVAGGGASSLAEGADGVFTVGSTAMDGGATWAALYVFEADGTLRRSTAYHGDETGVVAYGVTALAPVDGGTLVLGRVNHGPGRDAWLALVSDSGVVLWWKTIGGDDEDDPVGLVALDDGLLAWGSTKSPDAGGSGTGIDAWLLRTDVDGMLHFEAGNGFDARNDDVWWADWGLVVTATTPLPVGVPVTLTSTDVPLQMAPAAALTTTLSD